MFKLLLALQTVNNKCLVTPDSDAEAEGCECHESCADCGYGSFAKFETNCVSCPNGFAIFSMFDDGTGYCVKKCNTSGDC